MSLHLFATPVQCSHCGTTVDDPKLDRCPECHELLKERRTPRRIAGVEKRYGSLRFLLGFLRFLAVIVVLVGVLAFFFSIGSDEASTSTAVLSLLGSVLAGVFLFSTAAFFELAIDMEENTRSSFRVQQLIHEEIQERLPEPAPQHHGPDAHAHAPPAPAAEPADGRGR